MRKGEKGILFGIVAFSVIAMSVKAWMVSQETEVDLGIPFYSTSSDEFSAKASVLYRKYDCRDCHMLWGLRNIMQAVPAPSLDGMGSLRDEEWLYNYFSAKDPQSIVPSRLKLRFQMPSFAAIPEVDRRILAQY
ncbi:hypothetical protein JYT26_03000, partial [Beggiatoa alba]|nr:hypothetical protein [Beggiatoa alba]